MKALAWYLDPNGMKSKLFSKSRTMLIGIKNLQIYLVYVHKWCQKNVISTWSQVITQLLGCILLGQVLGENNSPLIMGFPDYGEHSSCTMWSFLITDSFFGKRPSSSCLIMLCGPNMWGYWFCIQLVCGCMPSNVTISRTFIGHDSIHLLEFQSGYNSSLG